MNIYRFYAKQSLSKLKNNLRLHKLLGLEPHTIRLIESLIVLKQGKECGFGITNQPTSNPYQQTKER
jgi:hypothetical protein